MGEIRTVPDEETVLQVKTVLAGVLTDRGVADIGTDADLVDELGLDSLQTISFLLGIEDAFDLELDYDNLRLDHLRSVRQFAAYVTRLRVAAP